MLATKNPARLVAIFLMAAGVAFLAGCMASGPRALLDGDTALQRGNYAAAIEKLTRAADLMPEEPRAWNLLGLAYHRAGQPQLAAQAYRKAMERDRSNLVSVARFNLGCLLLEQGNPAAAADELRSFTMVTNSAPALVKLGQAQLRLRQFDLAERSLAAALRMDPRDAEAYNNLGVLYHQRGRARDAVQYVNAALQVDPKFPSALLNSALLAHQSAATKAAALARYEEYLAVERRPAQHEAVSAVVRQLRADLAPVRPVQTNAAIASAPALRTNIVAAAPATNAPPARTSAPPRIQVAVTAAPPASVVQPRTNPPAVAAAATNTLPKVPATVVPKPEVTATTPPPAPPPRTSAPPVVVSAPVVPSNPPPVVAAAPRTNAVERPLPPPIQPTNAPPPEPPVTVVSVAPTAPPVVGAATTVTPPPAEATAPGVPEPPTVGGDTTLERAPKPGLFTRLNPFRGRGETERPPESKTIVVATNAPVTGPSDEAKTFPRYTYVNPRVPAPGVRAEAQSAFTRAVNVTKAGRTNDALREYEAAITADPAFGDAQYNYALLLMNSGEIQRSLPVWEQVMVIEPESLNARYNFALALRHAGFARDAVAELDRILEAKPGEARAHLMLGNIYAQQLRDNRRAREHYRKVIELDPRNPQAPAIRFWLAANP